MIHVQNALTPFGKTVREFRNKSGQGLSTMAKNVDTTPETLIHVEFGWKNVSFEIVEGIISSLNQPTDEEEPTFVLSASDIQNIRIKSAQTPPLSGFGILVRQLEAFGVRKGDFYATLSEYNYPIETLNEAELSGDVGENFVADVYEVVQQNFGLVLDHVFDQHVGLFMGSSHDKDGKRTHVYGSTFSRPTKTPFGSVFDTVNQRHGFLMGNIADKLNKRTGFVSGLRFGREQATLEILQQYLRVVTEMGGTMSTGETQLLYNYAGFPHHVV